MHVVATAGHVDHGKSTLVRALTGMEPDRWAEERRRGMTIDLGYAWMTLPSGEELAFVDVPGHQRFIGNMLAGLGPAPGVLFVVAADEGWAAQSEEHLAAVDALGLRHGLLAITKGDLADPTMAIEQSLSRLSRSSLGAVEHGAVSGATGVGVSALCDALDRLVTRLPKPELDERRRLWIDRAFTIQGSGTVVTGTLEAGSVAVGDEFELRGRRVTVRRVHALGEARDRVDAVARVALNLRGVAKEDVGRGDLLVDPAAWHWTSALDVRVNTDAQLPTNLMLHVGTAALRVRRRPLANGLARLLLSRPLPLQPGDRAILRDPSRHAFAAGVLVLDVDPPPLTRRGAAAMRSVQLASATGRPDARTEIAQRGAVTREHLRAIGVPLDDLGRAREIAGWLVADHTWQQWVSALPTTVDQRLARTPLDPGVPLDELRRELGIPDRALMAPLIGACGLLSVEGRVTRPGRATALGASKPAVEALQKRLAQAPFAAPEREELTELGLGRKELAAAERAGHVLRINADIVLLPSAPAAALKVLRGLPQPFTTSLARKSLDTTRRVAIPLLEYLDAHGWTERVDQQLRRVRPDRQPPRASTR
jgi:selenocysteine-specific elongation factor